MTDPTTPRLTRYDAPVTLNVMVKLTVDAAKALGAEPSLTLWTGNLSSPPREGDRLTIPGRDAQSPFGTLDHVMVVDGPDWILGDEPTRQTVIVYVEPLDEGALGD